ncbi:unnamed protein product [Lepidochelys kempii]
MYKSQKLVHLEITTTINILSFVCLLSGLRSHYLMDHPSLSLSLCTIMTTASSEVLLLRLPQMGTLRRGRGVPMQVFQLCNLLSHVISQELEFTNLQITVKGTISSSTVLPSTLLKY